VTELSGGDWFKPNRVSFPGIPGFNPNKLVGKKVKIDGVVYRVIGSETFAIHAVEGKPFSLVVQKGK
jgi:hypothetical protein